MSPAPRRVWLPWLLLLVPTLLIGAVALRLLWLEQQRIDAAETEAASRTAAATRERAQVAADNIELLVAEIRDGVMRELAETSPANLEALLANWPHTNPLVAETFLWKPQGGLAWPPADTTEHLAFRSRHAELFRGGVARLVAQVENEVRPTPVPAQVAAREPAPQVVFVAPKDAPAPAELADGAAAALQKEETPVAEPVPLAIQVVPQVAEAKFQQETPPLVPQQASFDEYLANATNAQVTQNFSLRRDVQQQAKASAEQARNVAPASAKKVRAYSSSSFAADRAVQSSPLPSAVSAAPATGLRERKAAEESAAAKGKADAEKKLQAEAAAAAVQVRETAEATSRQKAEPADAPHPASALPSSDDKAVPPAVVGGLSVPVPTPAEVAVAEPDGEASRAPWGAPISGWIDRTVGGKVYFLGWWQPVGGGAVRGAELNLPAVLERVQALVPARTADGGRFALRGPGEALDGATVKVPLTTTLPGWSLVGWSAPATRGDSLDVGGGFFVVAALLVGAFVISILAGGAMFFRQAAAAAREAALKTSFVSNVSHEMKTPLTTIRMYAEMLADERVGDAAKRARYFATIGRETARLTRLVNNALDFGRLEAGRKEYRPETIALGPWFSRLVETYAPRAAEAGVRLVATPPATGAAVRCDPDSLDQMALNLIDNGLKYGAAGGVLELHADAVAGGWAVVVADRGPGVPAAHRERIFDRFHRVDDALTATKQGAGLGLTIARRLIRDQGGDLVCHAREGGGAVFVLTLPVATAA